MRYAKTQKAQTKAHVLDKAAQALRREGVDGVGLVGLMGAAGLTKGGFYAHFASKDDLVAQVTAESLHASAERMQSRAQAAQEEGRCPLTAIVDAYLSETHAAARDTGCTMGALLSDLARASEPVRAKAAQGTAQMAAALEEALPASLGARRGARAQAVLGLLVGSLHLARVETDAQARSAMLASAREAALLLATGG